MRGIARRRHRFGSPRVYRALRERGWRVNHKRIERLWREESMQVPQKQHRRRRLPYGGSENSCVRHVPDTRVMFGRMTSLPTVLKTVERFDCW